LLIGNLSLLVVTKCFMNNHVGTKVGSGVKRIIGKRRKLLGTLGEELVVKHLKAKGYTHIESNYRKSFGEIDVIVINEGVIHFIEVKTVSREIPDGHDMAVIHETANRRSGQYRPEDNVDKRKIRKIARLVTCYLDEKGVVGKRWQFDIAAVYVDKKHRLARIRFIKDIPLTV